MPDIAEQLKQLAAQSETLGETLTERGVPASSSEGMISLVEKVKLIQQQIVNGTPDTIRVSASAQIYKGDFVRFVQELIPVKEARFEVGCKVINSAYFGARRVAAAYTKGGNTYIKAMKSEGETLVFGNSVVLIEGAELQNVEIVGMTDAVAVFYNHAGAGYAALVTYADLVGALAYTDVFDIDDPVNITAAVLEERKCIACGMHRADNSAFAEVVRFGASAVNLGAQNPLTLQHDHDEYAQGWSCTAMHRELAVLAYFSAHDAPIRFALLSVKGDGVEQTVDSQCINTGSLPVVDLLAISDDYFAVAGGVISVGEPNETLMTMEGWFADAKYGAQPYYWACEDRTYGATISRIYGDVLGTDYVTLSYAIDDQMHATIVTLGDHRPAANPAVALTAVSGFGRVHALNGTDVLGVFGREGNGYVAVYRRVRAVIPADKNEIEGLANSPGSPGEEIKVFVAKT